MSYTVDVAVPKTWPEVVAMSEWAKKNCPSMITVDLARDSDDRIKNPKHYRFFFGAERDAVAFGLMWI